MAADCPVCGEPVEYREVVPADGASGEAGATIDVDELCAADAEVRWNRICPRAAVVEDDDGADRPGLELYRHHWDSTA